MKYHVCYTFKIFKIDTFDKKVKLALFSFIVYWIIIIIPSSYNYCLLYLFSEEKVEKIKCMRRCIQTFWPVLVCLNQDRVTSWALVITKLTLIFKYNY